MSKLRCMVDIETLSSADNAVILQIGALKFELTPFEKAPIIKSEFLSAIDPRRGQGDRHIDPNTIKWWMEQDEEARKLAFSGEENLAFSLHKFIDWYRKETPSEIWAFPASFDINILTNAFKMYDKSIPWHYRDIRCLRTLVSFSSRERPEKAGIAHTAVQDCINQINWMGNVLKELNLS